MSRLSELDVLVVDCQATAAAPRGHLLELGWARARTAAGSRHDCLIALPPGERIPPAVSRITGITEQMMRDAVDRRHAWRALCDEAARLPRQPAPTVIHFARFEAPFLQALSGGACPLDIVCTRDIARRLLPGLPRCSLRALAGYFGRGVGALRRSAGHVEATAFVWQALVGLLEKEGVTTWDAVHDWLARSPKPVAHASRVWPMPRDVRLSLPAAPGVYRMLRTDGSVLYVGKAASLHHRVNSYFRKQSGVQERSLEMLSQARAISFEVTPSALEAALLETDEIKRHRPPYNVSLTTRDRALWFTSRDLAARSPRPTPGCPVGPIASAEALDRLAALARRDRAALMSGQWGPDAGTFIAGYERFRAAHRELSGSASSAQPMLQRPGMRLPRARPTDRDVEPEETAGEMERHLTRPERPVGARSAHAALLRLGTRLWREGRRDRDVDPDEAPDVMERGVTRWTPELVQLSLEWLVLRAALARRRAIWLTCLFESSVMWREPGDEGARLIVVERGEIVSRTAVDVDTTLPVPPGHHRPASERRAAFTLASFDRLRVLTTELKRLVAAEAPVAVRLGASAPLDGPRLASVLGWL